MNGFKPPQPPKKSNYAGRLTRVYGSISWAGFWVGLGIAIANW